MRAVELLSPARNADTAIEAIRHGADAVYIGAPSHGARVGAANSVDDIRRAVDWAHHFNARVYVTLNTLVYDDEIEAVERLVRELYAAGVDALIVQDMGVLRMEIPPIELHASTQCDTRDGARARFLAEAGFSQVVMAREMSAAEIAAASAEVGDTAAIEAFVHGALCVSYSGDCRASLVTTGRSANRGECAQVCRYSFDLVDADGRLLVHDRPLLSLRDMNRSNALGELLDAGVSSLKIEGRLKDAAYVKNVTARYHLALERETAARGLQRASSGRVELSFLPDESRSFNRGFTDYFLHGRASGPLLAGTAKAVGRPVGKIAGRRGRALVVNVEDGTTLANGDGLGYFDGSGRFAGFRVNRVEDNRLVYPASEVDAKPGTTLYRNSDKQLADMMARETARRTIGVEMTLRYASQSRQLVVDATDCRGNSVSVARPLDVEPPAATAADNVRRRLAAMSKTGGTIYTVDRLTDTCGDLFIPLSAVNAIRRDCLDALDRAQRANYRYRYRRPENNDVRCPSRLTYHDNVANHLARRFYTDHGAEKITPAAELDLRGVDRVMTTRYCLRREMGRCLRQGGGKEWKEPLTLRSGAASFGLEFDCSRCLMHLVRR